MQRALCVPRAQWRMRPPARCACCRWAPGRQRCLRQRPRRRRAGVAEQHGPGCAELGARWVGPPPRRQWPNHAHVCRQGRGASDVQAWHMPTWLLQAGRFSQASPPSGRVKSVTRCGARSCCTGLGVGTAYMRRVHLFVCAHKACALKQAKEVRVMAYCSLWHAHVSTTTHRSCCAFAPARKRPLRRP